MDTSKIYPGIFERKARKLHHCRNGLYPVILPSIPPGHPPRLNFRTYLKIQSETFPEMPMKISQDFFAIISFRISVRFLLPIYLSIVSAITPEIPLKIF